MTQFLAFSKKELLETWRTKKLVLLFVIFMIFGLMSPLVAKLTPEILKMSFEEIEKLPESKKSRNVIVQTV